MFRASVIPTSKELIKKVNSIHYCFIWNGNDKVRRYALISDIEMGGLKMLDIDTMISAKRVTCLKKFLEDYQSTWITTIQDKFLSPVGGRLVSCYREIMNELIWNNQFLCQDKKSMYRRDVVNLGFVKVGDLISTNNFFSYGNSPLVNPEKSFFS